MDTKKGFLRTFGRTASRMTLEEQEALEEVLAPFKLDVTALKTIAEGSQKVIVELGVGKGEQILARAEKNPQHMYIACEVFKNGLRSLVGQVTEKNIKNIKIYPDDARDLLKAFPQACVDQLLVLYPDPWPKKRHHRRRIVNNVFLDQAERILKPEGELILVTDIVDYALWMLHAVYAQGAFFPTATAPQAWAKPPKWWVQTGYERKALKEGRSPFYFVCQKREVLTEQEHNKGETTS